MTDISVDEMAHHDQCQATSCVATRDCKDAQLMEGLRLTRPIAPSPAASITPDRTFSSAALYMPSIMSIVAKWCRVKASPDRSPICRRILSARSNSSLAAPYACSSSSIPPSPAEAAPSVAGSTHLPSHTKHPLKLLPRHAIFASFKVNRAQLRQSCRLSLAIADPGERCSALVATSGAHGP